MNPPKTPRASRCVMSEIVLPNDTNAHGTMFGGRLLSLMDKCAAICAMRHAGLVCVTMAIDSVEFRSPLFLGEVVIIEAWVNRTFNTSLEVELSVESENLDRKERRECNHAYFTFVALDEEGRPTAVPSIHPETELEKERYEKAAMRRELRLHLKGRITLADTVYLKDDLIATISGRDL
ncbi:MAG: acyl-CoA thioesterase [Rhodothermaceae bacterium]|nr:acyl-CoA thioesterase [Rhodothermaceae bacterium]MYF40833.1 acyl-CoA thioesterase [Rhodothermaceae bacterium]